jgi:hypothetical protein
MAGSGPLTRVYGNAKAAILNRIDAQEIQVAANRRYIPTDFPIPNKLLAVNRSKANVLLEISPLVKASKLGSVGKKSNPTTKDK